MIDIANILEKKREVQVFVPPISFAYLFFIEANYLYLGLASVSIITDLYTI